MTMVTKRFSTAQGAIRFLEELALKPNDSFYFRGQGDARWRIEHTYARHSPVPHATWKSDLNEMVRHFMNMVLSTGKPLPFSDEKDLSSRLEFARHHGLPTPVLDWSFSPYVAMYFAFNSIRSDSKGSCSIYALRLEGIADIFARLASASPTGKPGPDYVTHYHRFFEGPDLSKGYPGGDLSFIAHPASWNVRMTRQMGSFIYDTLDYKSMGFRDFEDLLAKSAETPGPGDPQPSLYKINIPYSQAKRIFERLDLAAITGTRLLDDYEGAVADAKNAYVYNRKSGYYRDKPD